MTQRLSTFDLPGPLVFSAVFGVLSAQSAVGGEWEQAASVNVGSYYTTNVCRVNADIADEEGKAVGTFRPEVRVNGGGARSSLNLRAAAEYNSLGDSSIDCPDAGFGFNVENREAWVPSVNAEATFEALENWVELYGRAIATQNALNPFLSGGDDNASALGNTNIVYQWETGARVDRALPNNWRVLAEAGYNRQYNSFQRGFANSTEQRAIYDIGSQPFASRFFYGSRGSYSEIEFDETGLQQGFTNKLARAEVYAGITVTQALALTGAYGREDNVFTSTEDDIDGTFWDVGLLWRPLERIELSAGYGERFFGNTPRFNISYTHKRSTLKAAYRRDIQFPRNLRVSSGSNQVSDAAPPAPGVPGSPLENDGLPTFAGNSPIQNDAFSLSYSLSGLRSQFLLAASLSEQTQLATGAEGEFQSVRATINRNLSSALTGTLGIAWNRNDRVTGGDVGLPTRGFERWNVDIGLSRPLARDTDLSLRYRYTEQKSEGGAFNAFTEQILTLSVNYQF